MLLLISVFHVDTSHICRGGFMGHKDKGACHRRIWRVGHMVVGTVGVCRVIAAKGVLQDVYIMLYDVCMTGCAFEGIGRF